ncbi:cytochrome c oxidase assembly protein [Actinoalloteichus hymeniacidonis]|uniref:Membrane protein n=1 Tax=Actinoalloteichus hymeniacidonis TaxID=340345 RepID=A0AAC9HNC1_9PSEU|nr:cytochrome c oxidase assembly protein [Actinoalloteichus hymeniacidonis]AOS62381.1 putative membrane protein [Actinoalloteichus hymeniacidonis]MBB5909589.1 putative copper resistance protein D [Actinoalloteichus hymeniacidonis]
MPSETSPASDLPESDAAPRRRRATALAALLLPGAVFAIVLAALLTGLSSDELTAALGLPDPGAMVEFGLPVVRVVAELGAMVCIGSLLFAAFLVPPQATGMLAADGYAAARTAGIAGLFWAVGSILLVPLQVAEALGRPVSEVLDLESMMNLVPRLEQSGAWALTALLALVVAVMCRLVLTWRWTVAVFALALAALLPVVMTGHSATGGAHDVATNSLLFHLFAACLWIGGLIALLAHGIRRGSHLALATTRFSRIALVCWIVMACSGTINGLVRVSVGDLFTTLYGQLLLIKIFALIALGVVGYFQRERSVASVVATGSGRALVRLASVEVLLMLGTLGVSVALGRTPPPGELNPTELSRTELALGYNLDGPPSLGALALDWRFDLIFGTAAIVLAVLYLLGVRRLARRGDTWQRGRTIAWLAGCATLLIATSSGIGRYAPAMFSVHMGAHMLLAMLVPILLALGGPITLALRALPVAGRNAPPGPREWILAAMHSRVTRILTHPAVAFTLFVGSFYVLYFSGLFDAALEEHWAHIAMNAHFVITGYLFYWLVIGVDPAPRTIPPLGKLGLLFASMPFHAFFGIALMSSTTVIGSDFYRNLALPWATDLLEDQRLGGGLSWASGEIPVLVVLIALLVQWARSENRTARREDRRADTDGDADRAAYNEMLKKLSERP